MRVMYNAAMKIILLVLLWVVALEHILFLLLEMFFWSKPIGRRIFGTQETFARESASLAANQGLYNGFLAAGLVWGMFVKDPAFAFQINLFFLSCVLMAALFGGITAKRSILVIQGIPAAAALVALLLSK